jgi:predicted outer membrane repeat protein
MYPVTPARQTRVLLLPKTNRAGLKLLIACLVFASVALALYVRVDSKNMKPSVTPGSKDSKPVVTVQAAGRGGQYLHLQDGHKMLVNFGGNPGLTAALQSGQARPRSLASIDLNEDAAPDLLSGYAYGNMGILTVQPGNTDAFAPKDQSVYLRMHEGYNPNSLLPTAQTYQVPAAADFLQVGDFNNDQHKDVLVGAQHGDLFFLAGDGQGNLATPVQIPLAGVVTALAAGEFRLPDGRTDVAVGIDGPSGPQVLIFDGASGLSSQPMQLALTSPATALEFGEVDANPFMGLSIAAGNQIEIIHGWGRKQSPTLESRVERIDTGVNVRGLASGFFIWSRDDNKQLAALGDDGTIRIFGRGQLNTQPLTDEERMARGRLRLEQRRTEPVDLEMLTGWQAGQAESWIKARELATGNVVGTDASAQDLLRGTHISFNSTDDLMVLGGGSKLDILRQVDNAKSAPASANLVGENFTTTSLDSAAAPASVLALPQKLNGERELVVMQSGDVHPSSVTIVPNATLTVDRTDDPNGGALAAASVCGAGANDCSLRGAVQFANANPGTVISLGSATYTLNTNGARGCVFAGESNAIGDLEVTPTTTFTGTGSALTIINQIGTGNASFPGDRVLCMDVDLSINHTYTFSAMTIAGGRDFSGLGGGGFLGGAKGTALNLTDVTFANNQTSPGVPQGPVAGGGVGVTGGNMTVTNCTFGAANNPGATRTSVTLGNAANTLSGGGLSYSAGDPLGTNFATGTLTITGTTFTHNTASSVSAGGGGLDVFEFNVSATTANISTSAFTSNQATGTASGGGIINESLTSLTIATTSFTNNSAGNQGGGIYVGGGLGTFLNGTTPSITFSGNTATGNSCGCTVPGSSISAAGAVTASGTNTIIGGDLVITTNGTWTNSAGSVISPTNFFMTGTANFVGNNSTTNVGGNFNFGSGTFTAGTSTFNFNGSAPAQSITNSSSITFFNLTDSNTTNPLTLNNSFAVSGALTINGANAILAPVAGAIISGGGSLTGTGTARVTRTGADSFFTQYAMTGGRTLTNLTVEYIGAGAQTASTATYNNLKINNGSGVTLNAGNTIVNGTLMLTTGALNVAANTLTINDGSSVGTGTLTSGAAGIVNYNQSSAGQSVLAGSYGNLTFSAFTKVLPSTGTIGVASVFNPNGVTTGHTITGSTFDFNGTGAQTVPVFNYNNLTISGARGGATVTLAAGTIGVAATFNPSATAVVYSFTGNTFDFNGAGAQTIPAFNYNNLTISGNRAVAITLGNGNVGVAGVFNPSITGNTWTANAANVVVFNGAALQTIPAFAFFNGLTLANAAGANLGGNVTVLNGLSLNAGALGVGTNTLTLNGAVSFGAGSLTSSPTGTVIYNQQSNGQATVLAANYGNLTFSNFSKTLASTGTIGIAGTFTPGSGTGHTITGSTINFNGAGAQTIPGFTYNNLTSTGAVARTLDPVNTIKIAGVFTPGASTYTITGSTIEYNGSAAQSLPGTFLQYNNVTFNNPTTVTGGPATLDVNGNLLITQGTFAAGGSLSITVGGNWTKNGGAFSPSTGDVTFDGGAGQTIGGTTATTFNNLSVGNAVGLAMSNDNTVNGVLALVGSDITVAATKTLTQPNTGTSSGNKDVNGRLQRTGIDTAALGTTFSFGNPNNQITVTSGTRPANIVVDLTRSAPADYLLAVQRKYTITPNVTPGPVTLRLHYLDAELNGNDATTMLFRRFNGAGWTPVTPTSRVTNLEPNNWLEKTGQPQLSPWTFSSSGIPTATSGTITGRITDTNGVPIAGTVINLSGTQNRKTITDANGNYSFAEVETTGFYSVRATRANYSFSPQERSFSQLGNQTEAGFTATAMSVTTNPVDTPEYFVRQHYLDFLGREPDESGFNFWSDEILGCGSDAACTEVKRVNVSAAYFQSIEFQTTGALVDGLYRASFDRAPQYGEFLPDQAAVAKDVVVGRSGWEQQLSTNRQAFLDAFVQRPAFQAAYGGLNNNQYVDTLLTNTRIIWSQTERDALVNGLASGSLTRAGVLGQIAADQRFAEAKFNKTFVMMEYFGYLRRDPDADGYQYWLNKLNQFNGNFEQAEMVKAFIVSGEYRGRFPR